MQICSYCDRHCCKVSFVFVAYCTCFVHPCLDVSQLQNGFISATTMPSSVGCKANLAQHTYVPQFKYVRKKNPILFELRAEVGSANNFSLSAIVVISVILCHHIRLKIIRYLIFTVLSLLACVLDEFHFVDHNFQNIRMRTFYDVPFSSAGLQPFSFNH